MENIEEQSQKISIDNNVTDNLDGFANDYALRSSPKAYNSTGEWVGGLSLVSVVFFNHLCNFVFLYFRICMSGWAS